MHPKDEGFRLKHLLHLVLVVVLLFSGPMLPASAACCVAKAPAAHAAEPMAAMCGHCDGMSMPGMTSAMDDMQAQPSADCAHVACVMQEPRSTQTSEPAEVFALTAVLTPASSVAVPVMASAAERTLPPPLLATLQARAPLPLRI